MYQELESAKRSAVRAGAILLEHQTSPSVGHEGNDDRTVEARQSVREFLIKELQGSFPEDAVLSEGDFDCGNFRSKSRAWMVDPLDGASEYDDGHDEFAVMIGLSVGGTANLGVIYQPRTEKMYYALLGTGAFLIENRATRLLRVPHESDPLAMTMVHNRMHRSPDSAVLQRELGFRNSIVHGGIGLNVGLICEGLAHLYVHGVRHSYLWETCAPEVVLHEAGGRMTNRFNAPLRYDTVVRNPGPVIASNGVIHDRIVDTAQALLPPHPDRRNP
jgi:3'(2'), 5'-bisphosphate nucleotidase